MSSTLDIGKKLVELCRQGKEKEALDSLYSPNIVSIDRTTAREAKPAWKA